VWLRVLAEEDVDAALHALYIDPAQGSLRGAKALYERALAQYVGVTMRSVQSFLRRQETRQAVLPKQGYLVAQPADAEDVGHWQADLTDVPLFTSSDAPHMLVCVDMFSKYAWAVPLKSKHAAHIVAALEAIMLQEGPPDTLRTDGGSDMNNGDVAALCRRFNVARKVCAPYNSQCNGGVERLHRTLKDALVRQAHEWMSAAGTVDWVSMLPHVLYGYNTSVHATTGYTPFYLQRGRKPRPLGPLPLAARHGSAAAGPLFHGHEVSARPAPAGRSNGVAASGVAHSEATAAANALEEVDTGMETDTDKAHDISRVIATRKDAVHKETRYWVRWAGVAASRDSWITAPMAGVSDRQLQAWVRRTHRSYMPVALPEPFVTPQGRERLHVRVSDADRDALAVAQGQLEGGTTSSCACAGDAAAIAIRDVEVDAAARPHADSSSGRGAVLHELEDALHRALAIARLLQPLTEQGAQHP
jgi:transposase InsO family protein